MSASRHAWPLHLTGALVVAAAAVSIGAAIAGSWDYTVDDAFITFRYAQRWADGQGLTWNPGERQEGYTSMLHVAVLAALHVLGAPLAGASKVVGTLCLLAALLLWAQCARRWTDGSWAAVALVFAGAAALPQVLPVHAVAGLETPLFMALWGALALLADAARFSAGRAVGLGVLSLALGLCRPEGNLVAGATWAALLITHRDRATRSLLLRGVGTFVLPAAAYFAWRAWYYGVLLPLPFYVKVAAGTGLRGLPIARSLLEAVPKPLLILGALGLLWTVRGQRPHGAGAATGPASPRSAWGPGLPVLLPWLSFVVFLLWPEHVMGFDFRFFAPATLPLLAWAAVGAHGVAVGAGRRLSERPRLAGLLAGGGLAVSAAWLLPPRSPAAQAEWSRRRFSSYAEGLARAHGRLGAALAASAGAFQGAPVLAIGDCGLVPFLSRWTTLDTFGLNDARIARLYPPRDASYTALVFDRRPDVLVLISASADVFRPHLAWEQLLYDEALRRGFEPVRPLEFGPGYELMILVSPEQRAGRLALEAALK
jgi:arabinofuranosyltransferase